MLEATVFQISTAEDYSLNSEISKIRHSRAIELESVRRMFLESNGKLPKAERIASELCLSVRTFNRYLKNSGVSYRELQEDVRKQKASEFLLKTDKSIKSISETMGYANPSNFTKAFKAWFGMTPKEFRKNQRVF